MRNLTYFLLLFFCLGYAQENEHAWIYFNDKPSFDTYLDNPNLIFTEKSIQKKNNKNIPIDYLDVPVDIKFIDSILSLGNFEYLAKSKWFNFIHIIGNENEIQNLENVGFVKKVVMANRTINKSTEYNTDLKFLDQENDNPENQIEMIGLDYLHDLGFRGEGISIAIFDAGFRNVDSIGAFSRIHSLGNIKYVYDFVDKTNNLYSYTGNSHGTLVFSVMAGFIESEFIGSAPDSEYYLFRTEDVSSETPAEESYWIEAIEVADSLGVDITNTSLGYKNYDNENYSYQNHEMNGYTALISKASNIAFNKGIILINSAGNSSNSGVIAPADSPNVLSIGAVNNQGDYAFFSSQGNNFQPTTKPDIVAQGYGTFVVNAENELTKSSGTSFSSPVISGAIACLYQAFNEFSNKKIYNVVRNASSQFYFPDSFLGYGIPNFEQAYITSLKNRSDEFVVYPTVVIDDIRIINYESQLFEVKIFDTKGKNIFTKKYNDIQNNIDLAFLANGFYYLNIKNFDGEFINKKIIKK